MMKTIIGVTAIRHSDGTIQCKKCKRFLARLDDGVLRVGGIVLWNEARFSCAACGKVYLYGEEASSNLPEVEKWREIKPESIARRERERAKRKAS